MRARDHEPGFVDVPVRVRYADTDRMGIVYYGNYPIFFEIGRSEYMREKGFTYREFEESGYHLVVVGMEMKYYNAATYDDLLIVKTRVSELKSRGLTFHYIIYCDGNLIVEGKTRHVCVNTNKKPVLIPQHLFNILRDVNTR
ncbi:MAG TPA: thioesterase family protein [Syntrophorhabdaceae bacterium]|nr:thioesterase family protein [Syntrophorhabdaceae bacterium]HNT67843.1 thioesterase family protein [Syntrophorhabdaceae bacterium]